MRTRRRHVLALTGALLAGMAGCVGDAGDDTGDDGTTDAGDADGDDTGDPAGEGTPGSSDTPPDEEDRGFDDYAVPQFPDIDPVTEPEIDESLLAEQIRGNVEFSLDLLGELRSQHPDENVFYSPYSVSIALAMTYAGARGETATEMANALRYELDGDDLHAAFGALEAEFVRRNEDGQEVDDPHGDDVDEPAFQLSTANTTWGQEGYPFREAFLDLLDAYYGAGMQLVDFEGDHEAARERINEWVEERTNDRIEELLDETDVSELTRLVLTNAIYFVGMWKYDFPEENTGPGTFTSLDGSEHEIRMMQQSIEVPYVEIDGHQLVELPYENDDTSMVIVLPAAGKFEEFEAEFSVDRLATMLDNTTAPEVDLTVPRFGIESRFSLVETMQNMGMELPFTGAADFSGMVEGGGLEVAEIVHQSFVDVDEKGTEAAAATAVVMEESGPPGFAEMTVDRPFLFYIRDRPTETPLFVGRVVDGETLQDE